MRFDVLTLFPEMFAGYLGQSLLAKAIARDLIQVVLHNFRNWSHDPRHHKVDDRPYGGGPGMVLQVEPIVECVEAIRPLAPDPGHLVYLTPQGRPLTQRLVEEWASQPRIILLCGRYEGVDQRVLDLLQPDEVSLGDYILNGGEVAAMAVMDALLRLVPGVLGDEDSSVHDSFSSGNRWLEGAQYTRPREYRGLRVPEILMSGDHAAIARWRSEQSYLKTRRRRADLLEKNEDSCS
ncbi:MAG: tRNA (guanosine(37)-N1)-methyltransferase TrmD [Pirellulales bacterium]